MASMTRVSALVAGAILLASCVGRAQQRPPVVAEVNGTTITADDVDASIGLTLGKLQEEIYTLRRNRIEAMIDDQLVAAEAKRQGTTAAELIKHEVADRVPPVSAEDVQAFYDANKARLPATGFETLGPQIKNYLAAQRLQTRRQEYIATLRAPAKITVSLPAPPIYRTAVPTGGAPVRGAATAPVTIVEFSDFHCPFCRKVEPTIAQVLAKYDGKVKLVYRDMPLDSLHPNAGAAAEAARCAGAQGKFWEYHDKLLGNEPDVSAATLDRFAQEVGADVTAFEACRTSGKYAAAVDASEQEGAGLGISGTPTFFINGRSLTGAQPFEAFAKIIDEELAGASTRRP